jgi:hypothetical protein
MPLSIIQIDHLADSKFAAWQARLPASGPAAFRWPHSLAELHAVPSLVADLRRVVNEITDSHWLRVYVHKPLLVAAARDVFASQVPHYHPPAELCIAGQSAEDAQQELWQRDVGDNVVALSLAILLFGEDRYITSLRHHVLEACTYPTWGDMDQATNRDLACAHLLRGLAIALDWVPKCFTTEERSKISNILESRANELLIGACGGAFWHDSWRDNHCHNSLAALGMCGLIFLDKIPAARRWLAAAELGFERVAELANEDGSSAEGVPYWSYGMSFLLQYIEAARNITGADRFYSAGYFRNAFNYRLQSSTPALGATLPFGDALKHDYYGPAFILRAFAREYQDGNAQWFAEQIRFLQTGGADCEAWNLLWNDSRLPAVPPNLPLDAHFPVWDVAVSRTGWEQDDQLLAVKSGFTNRNHSHLDVGAIVVAWGDEWLLTAPGYGITGPGFWDSREQRWTYYSNATESHNTLLINGKNQRHDPEARGTIEICDTTSCGTRIVIDLTNAYYDVRRVRREIVHVRRKHITIYDEIELTEPGTVEWLLQPGGKVELNDGKVIARGTLGQIEVSMLSPQAPFQPRQPTRQHIDVPLSSIKTHAVSQTGKVVRFECKIVFL